MMFIIPIIDILIPLMGFVSYCLSWNVAFYILAIITLLRWLPYMFRGSMFFKELIQLIVFSVCWYIGKDDGIIVSFAVGLCVMKFVWDTWYMIKFIRSLFSSDDFIRTDPLDIRHNGGN